MMGRHSTILKPDSVSRVIPPTTTIPKTKEAERNNHLVTAGPDSGGSSVTLGPALLEDSSPNGEEAEVKKLQKCCSCAVGALELRHRGLSTKYALPACDLEAQPKARVRIGVKAKYRVS